MYSTNYTQSISNNNYKSDIADSISVLNIPPKSGKLRDYAVYYNDTDITSKFFNIRQFPSVLASGKNYFLITGTDLLQPTTNVAIEVLDVNGNRLETDIPNILINGTDRAVIISVYPNDYYGMATITVLGEARDVPKNWKGTYNVKWEQTILCNPTIDNDSDVIFENDPYIVYDEIYDNSGSISKLIKENVIYNQGLMYSKVAGTELSPLMEYQLYLTDGDIVNSGGSFSSLEDWNTGSLYVDDAYISSNKLYISQSYGLFGITTGVTQSFGIIPNRVYTLTANFIGSESNLGGSVASVAVYSGSNVMLYLYSTSSADVTLTGEFSSSKYITASIELGGQAFAIQTVWSNVYVQNLISGSTSNGFVPEMEGGYLTVTNKIISNDPHNLFINESYNTYIKKVVNNRLAIANTSYQPFNVHTGQNVRKPFYSGSYSLSYIKSSYITNNNVKRSFLRLKLKNLNTIVGSLKYVELYSNPGNNYLGKYSIVAHRMLNTGSEFSSSHDFTDHWSIKSSGSYTDFSLSEKISH